MPACSPFGFSHAGSGSRWRSARWQRPRKAQSQAKPSFTFAEVDLKLLAEVEALDRIFEQRGLVLHDEAIDGHIAALAAPLLPAQPVERVSWRVRVLRDPSVNAFALPNGSIYLQTGLLARAENDHQVAAVLGHEIAHVANRHGYIFHRSLRKRSAAINTLGAVGSWIPFGGALGSAAATATTVSQFALIVSIYGYSQDLEEEADRAAVERLKASGRDPAQFARIMEILDERIEPRPEPLFLRTHPKAQKRIAAAKAALGIAGDIAPAPDRAYLDRMLRVLLQNVQLDLDSRRFRSAVLGASRLAEARPDDPEAVYWLAEAYRALGPRRPRLTEKQLTYWSQRRAWSAEHNRTEEEQARRLSATPDGQAALRENLAKARDLFAKASALDPAFAKPYLGLGSLCQSEGKTSDALAAYQRFLDLAPAGPDRARVERRIGLLEGGAK